MNTKGMKFLTVLAVLAMAFAAFAVIAPAEQSDAVDPTTATWSADKKVLTDTTGTNVSVYSDKLVPGTAYYVGSDASITVDTTTVPTAGASCPPVLVLIEQGKTFTVNGKENFTGAIYIAFLSVVKSTSGTSTIYTSATPASAAFCELNSSSTYNLKLDSAFADIKDSVSVGLSSSLDSTDILKYTATSKGISIQASGVVHVITPTYSLAAGSVAKAINYSGETATITLSGYSGTLVAVPNGTEVEYKSFTGTVILNPEDDSQTVSLGSSSEISFVVTKSEGLVITEDVSGNVKLTGKSATIDKLKVPVNRTLTSSLENTAVDATATGLSIKTGLVEGTLVGGILNIDKLTNTGSIQISGASTVTDQLTNSGSIKIAGTSSVASASLTTGAIINNTAQIAVGAYGLLEIQASEEGAPGVTGLIGGTAGQVTVSKNGTLTVEAVTVGGAPFQLNTNTIKIMKGGEFTNMISDAEDSPLAFSASAEDSDYVLATINGAYKTDAVPGFTYTVDADITVTASFLIGKDVCTVASGSTVTISGDVEILEGTIINNYGEIVITDGAEFKLAAGSYLINSGTIDIKDSAKLTMDNSKAGEKIFQAGVDGITGTGFINVMSGTLTAAVDNSTDLDMLITCGIRVYTGAEFVSMIGTQTGDYIKFSDAAGADEYVQGVINGEYAYTAIIQEDKTYKYEIAYKPGWTYTLLADVTINNEKEVLNAGDVVINQAGQTLTVTAATIPEGVTLRNYGTLDITKLTNNGTIENYGTIAGASSEIYNNGVIENMADGKITFVTLNNATGAEVNNAGEIVDFGEVTNTGSISNSKTVSKLGTITGSGYFENTGTIVLTQNTAIYGVFLSTGTFTAGSYDLTINAGTAFAGDVTFTATGAKLVIIGQTNNGGIFEGNVIYSGSDKAKAYIAVQAGDDSNFSVLTGSLTMSGSISGAYPGSQIDADTGTIILSGVTIDDGSITLAGAMTVDGLTLNDTTVSVDSDAKITVADDSIITVNDGAVLAVDGTVKGAGTIVNDGIVKTSSTASLIVAVTGNEPIDEDGMKDEPVSGEASGYHEYSDSQIVTVNGTWTLTGDTDTPADIWIKGKLVIPEGAVLNIEANAKLTLDSSAKIFVYGTLNIEEKTSTAIAAGMLTVSKGTFYVYGTVYNNGIISLGANQEVEVFENGIFTIGGDGLITTDNSSKFVIDAGAFLNVYGSFNDAEVYNAGTVTIDSDAPATGSSVIYQQYAGAIVDVIKYTVLSSEVDDAYLVITDDGLRMFTYRENGQTKYVTNTNVDAITISLDLLDSTDTPVASSSYSVSFYGLKVESKVTNSTSKTVSDPTNGIYKNKLYTKQLYIKGDLTNDYDNVGTGSSISSYVATSDVTMTGAKLYITETLDIDEYITVLNEGTLDLTGEIDTYNKYAVLANNGTITVTKSGLIRSVGSPISSEDGINATKIKVPTVDSDNKRIDVYHYMHINAAIAMLNDSTDLIEATELGKQTVTATIQLDEPNKLVVTGVMTVGTSTDNSVVLTLERGSSVKGVGSATVLGKIYAENKQNISGFTIKADVYSEEVDAAGKAVKDGWAIWSCVAVALQDAEVGDTVKLKADTTVYSSLTVPVGVTLEIPAGMLLNLADGVTLTVDGAVTMKGDIAAETGLDLSAQDRDGFYASAIIVNGAVMSTAEVDYASGSTGTESGDGAFNYLLSEKGAPIAGAYYQIRQYSVISNIDDAMEIIDTIQSDITVYGSVSSSVLTFTATENCEKLIVSGKTFTTGQDDPANPKAIANELKLLSLTLDGATLIIDNNANANGTFTGIVIVGDNSVALSGVSSGTAAGLQVYDSSDKLYMKGTAVIDEKGDLIEITSGTVYTDPITVTQAHAPTDTEALEDIAFDYDFTTYVIVDEGATLAVDATDATKITNMIVYGTVSVPAAYELDVSYIDIFGTLDIAKATGSSAKGNFKVVQYEGGIPEVNVGMDETERVKTASLATVSGPVNAGSAVKTIVYVLAGSSVDTQFQEYLDGMAYSTTFYAEGFEWFTVYSNDNSHITVDATPIDDTYLEGWAASPDGSRINTGAAGNPEYYVFTIGQEEALYAVLDHQLYQVRIYTDQGFQNISIDGKVLDIGATGTNVYVTSTGLIAGKHTVTYQLKNGFTGTPTLSLQDTSDCEAVVTGLDFTISGNEYGVVYLQLKGVTGGNSESSHQDLIDAIKENTQAVEDTKPTNNEWTVTTILLVVLVIIIAIMAVVLILRLNRH